MNAVKTPFVWAPLLAVALVLVGVSVPPLVNSALSLIGQATGGVALFVAGLMIAAHKVIFNLEVGVNTVLKMLVQPAVFFLLALAFGVKPPFLYEGLLLTALPSGPMGILLATRNKMYRVGCILGPCGHLRRNADHASHHLVPDWSCTMI